MHLNNGGFAYDGFFRYSGVSLYCTIVTRVKFDPIFPQEMTTSRNLSSSSKFESRFDPEAARAAENHHQQTSSHYQHQLHQHYHNHDHNRYSFYVTPFLQTFLESIATR